MPFFMNKSIKDLILTNDISGSCIFLHFLFLLYCYYYYNYNNLKMVKLNAKHHHLHKYDPDWDIAKKHGQASIAGHVHHDDNIPDE